MSAGYNHASRGRININLEIKEVSSILAEKQSVMLRSKNFVATRESRVYRGETFPRNGVYFKVTVKIQIAGNAQTVTKGMIS